MLAAYHQLVIRSLAATQPTISFPKTLNNKTRTAHRPTVIGHLKGLHYADKKTHRLEKKSKVW